MGSYSSYLKQTQRFLREAKQEFLNPQDLLEYVNRARREVAMRAMCVRRLTSIDGSIATITLLSGGHSYSSSPVVTISAPDFPSGQGVYPNGSQATASAVVSAGVIQQIVVTYGGSGYFEPTVTITDTTGIGAAASANVVGVNLLNPAQEQYPLSEIDVSNFPGVDSVYLVHSVSIIYADYRYSLPQYSFTTYQAMIRQYPFQYQYVPTMCSQTGQGVDGIIFMYPLPAQPYQVEYDCFCLPQDLTATNSQDVIPRPWDDVVPYFAAHLAYLEIQNLNAARYYLDLYDQMLVRYSTAVRFGRAVNPYGRY